MSTCHICKRELNVDADPMSVDCGGDCLKCMADAGDPDAIFALKEAIWLSVHELVDAMTKGLPLDADELIRLQLTEEFRFWRRD